MSKFYTLDVETANADYSSICQIGIAEFSNGELAYITKRFDYSLDNNIKYDQEDFASVLEVTKESHGENYKYDAKTYLDCPSGLFLFFLRELFYKQFLLF